MLIDLLTGGFDKQTLISVLLCIPIVMLALSFHEAAHGYVAYKLGDPTAKNLGRLTLNPLKHLDPIGVLVMLVCGFGWAKPVPINTRNFSDPRKGMALTGIAGPVSNLILGLANCVLYYPAIIAYNYCVFGSASESICYMMFALCILFRYGAILNFGLMAFNLLPVPPFDGSRFFYYFLPSKFYFKVMKYEQTIMIVILLLFLALSRVGLSPISYIADGLFRLAMKPLPYVLNLIF